MEWTNPKYVDQVAILRAHQAARPKEKCPRCKGLGTELLPESHGATSVRCQPCEGTGERPASVRGFIAV